MLLQYPVSTNTCVWQSWLCTTVPFRNCLCCGKRDRIWENRGACRSTNIFSTVSWLYHIIKLPGAPVYRATSQRIFNRLKSKWAEYDLRGEIILDVNNSKDYRLSIDWCVTPHLRNWQTWHPHFKTWYVQLRASEKYSFRPSRGLKSPKFSFTLHNPADGNVPLA